MVTKPDQSGPYRAGEARLRVKVCRLTGEPIDAATVTFRPAMAPPDSASIRLEYDKSVARHVAVVPVGDGELAASGAGFQGQSFEVHVDPGANDELVVLAADGQPTYFRGRKRMPIDAGADLLGVKLDLTKPGALARLQTVAKELNLTSIDINDLSKALGLRLFRARPGEGDAAVTRLTQLAEVQHAGAAISWRKRSFSFLSRDVVVRFRKASADEAAEFARSLDYVQTREVRYSPATFVWRWNPPATRALLASTEAIARRDDVVWVQPNLIHSADTAAVSPTDTLWPGLWNLRQAELLGAWDALEAASKPKYGSPDVVLAIWDTGVKSAGGMPVHRDFNNVLDDGSAKVAVSYDFINKRADNDNVSSDPNHDHGGCVASIASALADNPPIAGGKAFGALGAAPNVALMTIIGDPTSNLSAADQFVWMAGFDPGDTSYPAPPVRPADIINCSLIVGEGSVLDPTAQAALDWVTSFGRGGKGTLCFFAAGNVHRDTDIDMPWSSYKKSFGIAASTVNAAGNDIHATYSNYGWLELCAPTGDGSLIHDPPAQWMVWGASDVGKGDLVSLPETTKTLSAGSTAGDTEIKLDSVSGLSVGDVIYVGAIGAAGSEQARIEKLPIFWGRTVTVSGFGEVTFDRALRHDHAAGDAVIAGPADYRSNFWGTSAASPLAAGVAALVLSAKPDLTFVEVRQILRDKAFRFDLGNTDSEGQWLDSNLMPSRLTGLPPVVSRWYGHGRIDAAAAVQAALDFTRTSDLVIRDNLADLGTVPSNGDFANTPDVWCRRLPPGADPGALPANYAIAGPHENPLRGQSNWLYARVHNNGTGPSLDAWVRVSVAHFPGLEFTYPSSFQPSNGPGTALPAPMTPGTYFIGEAKVSAVPPGGEQIVTIEWKADLIPPAQVLTSAGLVQWHPCLLAEVTPHDGPAATGNHVWDCNNLAQKNITIVDASPGSDFGMAITMGDGSNEGEFLLLEVQRGELSDHVQLYLDLLDLPLPHANPGSTEWKVGERNGRPVVFLAPLPRVRVPVLAKARSLSPVVVGGAVGSAAHVGDFAIRIVQRQPSGKLSGAATLTLKIRTRVEGAVA